MKGTVYAVGKNDADYPVRKKVDGRDFWCPYYRTWLDMMKRAYCKKYKERNPAYADVTVCHQWHSFMNFRSWMIQQDYESKFLDKDILILGNKIYKPEACVFVSRQVNNLFTDHAARRGELPIGVSYHKKNKKYQAHISINGKRKYICISASYMLAHCAWQREKADLIEKLAIEQDNQKIKNALILRVKHLRDDLANARETIKL